MAEEKGIDYNLSIISVYNKDSYENFMEYSINNIPFYKIRFIKLTKEALIDKNEELTIFLINLKKASINVFMDDFNEMDICELKLNNHKIVLKDNIWHHTYDKNDFNFNLQLVLTDTQKIQFVSEFKKMIEYIIDTYNTYSEQFAIKKATLVKSQVEFANQLETIDQQIKLIDQQVKLINGLSKVKFKHKSKHKKNKRITHREQFDDEFDGEQYYDED